MDTQVMSAQTLIPNFGDFISLYQNQIQQLHQEVEEMYTHHDHQDLINTYAEYISELDEFFNYPNSRGDYE